MMDRRLPGRLGSFIHRIYPRPGPRAVALYFRRDVRFDDRAVTRRVLFPRVVPLLARCDFLRDVDVRFLGMFCQGIVKNM